MNYKHNPAVKKVETVTTLVSPESYTLTLSTAELAVLSSICGNTSACPAHCEAVANHHIKPTDISIDDVMDLLTAIYYINKPINLNKGA